jgi:AraC-like DNA-binding protein
MAPGDPSEADEAVLDVRPDLTDAELNELFGASWPDHRPRSFAPVLARSLTWIAARRAGRLVGFVNVAGDGGVHAFVLDTTVHPDERRQQDGQNQNVISIALAIGFQSVSAFTPAFSHYTGETPTAYRQCVRA